MKTFFSILAIALLYTSVQAQRPSADVIKTNSGDLIIQPIAHSTLVLTWNSKTIYIDPTGGTKAFEGLKSPDLIFITDIHGDHMNIETLNVLDVSKATIIAPKAVSEKLPSVLLQKTIVINNGEKKSQSGIEIEAIPMYNLPEDSESRHTRGRGNGYVLTFGGKRIYISGDTEDIDEMRALRNIDVAFVCMNMPYTMDINQASSAVLAFKPKIVYPFHYRGSDTEAFKKLVNDGDGSIDVRLRNWYLSN